MTTPTAVRARGRRRIVSDTAQLVVRTVFQQVLGFGRNLLLPNILGPLHYGSLATILLVERYSTYVNLGINAATLYQVPPLRARGADTEARRIHDDVVGFSTVAGLVASVGLLVWTWWRRDSLGPELVAGLVVAAALPPLIALRGALIIWARVNSDFHAVSRGGMVSAFALFGSTILFGYLWQTVGVIAGHVLAYALLVVYLIGRPLGGYRGALRPRAIVELLRSTASITALSVTIMYLMTVDRLAIASGLSVEQVGYYAVGQLLAGVLLLVPNAVGEAIGPTLIADSDVAHDDASAQPFLFRVTIVLAIFVAVAAAGLIAALPGVVAFMYARYGPAVPAAQLLCLVAYFEAVGLGAHYVVSTRGGIKLYIAYTVVLAGVAAIALPMIGRRGGITAIAAAMVVLTAVRTLWVSWTARRLTGVADLEALRDVFLLLLIGLAALVVPLTVQLALGAWPWLQNLPAPVAPVIQIAVTVAALIALGIALLPAYMRLALSALRHVHPAIRQRFPQDNAPTFPPTA